MPQPKQHVAVLGASDKPQRYSYKAAQLLRAHGHIVHPVTNRNIEVEEGQVYEHVSEIASEIDTLTLYVNPEHQKHHTQDIIAKKPRRIIFNPGTECEEHEALFEEAGIKVDRACTIVLLKTGQFHF